MNEKRKTYLAFDIDGTIYDAAPIVVDAFSSGIMRSSVMLGKTDMKPPEKDTILSLVGSPAEEIFSTFFPGLSPDELRVVGNACNDSFIDIISNGGGRLMEGAYEVLRDFHRDGYIILTASNGRREYVESILETNGIGIFFNSSLHFVEGDITDKRYILPLYKERLLPNDILIMIGDRESDRAAAYQNNVPFIGCAFGHAGDTEIQGERWIVHSFREIPQAVHEIEAGLW
jgi:phosphoglycolate phosphatase